MLHAAITVAKDTKQKRMRVMMENAATFSDVEFRVGPEDSTARTFLGLKAIFARASEVFSKMFFETSFKEVTPGVAVHITDIQPEAFEQLHRWVYDMDVTLTYETVFGVIDAARKYMVEDLELYSRRWVASSARTVDGALGLYACAASGRWHNWANALVGRVEFFGLAQLSMSSSLPLLPFEAFLALLSSPDLGVPDETYVFEAAKAWVDGSHKRGEEPSEGWNHIVEAQLINFHLLEPRFFAEKVVLPGLISQEQALVVFVDSSLGRGKKREVSLVAELRRILANVHPEDAVSLIEPLVELRFRDGYPRALGPCLVERALADSEHCSEWVSMWMELWGALRVDGLRDDSIRATVDYCQNLFEEVPGPDGLVGVWTCPSDTLGLVRILCRLNDFRKLAVLPLIKVLEDLILKAEESSYACCGPAEAATELVAHLNQVASRLGHLSALQLLPSLRERLEKLQVKSDSP